jgi:hypothetical protein
VAEARDDNRPIQQRLTQAAVAAGTGPSRPGTKSVSAPGCPAHPRPVRSPADKPSGRSARSRSQSPGPGPAVRAAPHSGALLKHSGHPGETRGTSDARFGGGSVLSRRAPGSGMTRRQLCDRRIKPLLPASLTLRTGPGAELRHSCAQRRPGHGRGPKWLCPRAQKWLCFVARYQLTQDWAEWELGTHLSTGGVSISRGEIQASISVYPSAGISAQTTPPSGSTQA